MQLAPAGSPLAAGAHGIASGAGSSSMGSSSASGDRGVMFVPQRPLAAPGGALWQQICYPGDPGSNGISGGSSSLGSSTSGGGGGDVDCGQQQLAAAQEAPQECRRPPDGELLALLQRVGLQYLLDRVGGSFSAAADWGAMLSPGELQRLSVARVLHRWAAAGGVPVLRGSGSRRGVLGSQHQAIAVFARKKWHGVSKGVPCKAWW